MGLGSSPMRTAVGRVPANCRSDGGVSQPPSPEKRSDRGLVFNSWEAVGANLDSAYEILDESYLPRTKDFRF